ncbi:hypothetical protein RRG08_058742 [Elysia crispata]|uniref:Uncharacterized protein n=1 Tax=Elysia crispata TaxID=231223 RepID=A0AAE0YYA8_9GAST|nr:hypothetical protein RRG08_058742 [Elysia crispata]
MQLFLSAPTRPIIVRDSRGRAPLRPAPIPRNGFSIDLPCLAMCEWTKPRPITGSALHAKSAPLLATEKTAA